MDLLVIAEFSFLDPTRLQTALKAVFENRDSHELPVKLPAPPDWWERGMSRIMGEMDRVDTLEEVYARASGFLDPILEGSVDGRWNPVEWTWDRAEP